MQVSSFYLYNSSQGVGATQQVAGSSSSKQLRAARSDKRNLLHQVAAPHAIIHCLVQKRKNRSAAMRGDCYTNAASLNYHVKHAPLLLTTVFGFSYNRIALIHYSPNPSPFAHSFSLSERKKMCTDSSQTRECRATGIMCYNTEF
uniref:Uncharacterized protein n=1 Tax=Trypanosoma congolense (strain IL3000) TaxID=1068625 RepID=G0UQ26_TRYCI|nr:hypothetical protein, unlikely [Trypanosoma congolense IL3000]